MSASRAFAEASRGAAAFSVLCSADFDSADLAGCGAGCAAVTLLTALSSARTLVMAGDGLSVGAAASVCGEACGGSCTGAEAGLGSIARGTGCAGAVATDIGSADILRSSLETPGEVGLAMFAAR
jgi:hypothetical protein